MSEVRSASTAWRDLEPELRVLGEVQRGDRLRVMKGVQIEKAGRGIASAVARWLAGEGRAVTIRWMCDLCARLTVFCKCCVEQAKSAGAMGEASTSFAGDACPQCLRVRCGCAQMGLLRAVDSDLEKAIDGITRLSLTYSDDAPCQTQILNERESFKRLKKEISGFLRENEG